MKALLKNKICILVPLHEGMKMMDCKWVFSVKQKEDGSIEKYKAKLVAKEYTQTYSVDYQETFLLVIKINIVRILLSLTTNLNWPLHQFDVKYLPPGMEAYWDSGGHSPPTPTPK